MVKVGFIVEGATEKIVLEKSDFFEHLISLNITYVPEVIDAKGNGNLLPHKIASYIESLQDEGATDIFILTDLDEEQCITNTKGRIAPNADHYVVVSIQAVEAWFLSDTDAMRKYFNDPAFYLEHPETVKSPFEEIKNIRRQKSGRGFNDKKVLANTLVHKMGFSILKAAQHPNCNSAKYFLNKLRELSGN